MKVVPYIIIQKKNQKMNNNKFIIMDDNFDTILIPKRILVFAPHPDDEIISCGGTLLKYQELGSEIIIVFGTSGLGGYSEIIEKNKIKEIRENELNEVIQALNWKAVNLGFSDLNINRDKVSCLTNLIREYKPHVILAPHYNDIHRVHRNYSLIIRESIYHCVKGTAYGANNNKWIPFAFYYYETPSYKFHYSHAKTFIIVDIDEYWDKKKNILNKYYKSQAILLEQIFNWIKSTAFMRGNEINKKFGEAYIPDTSYVPLRIILV